jgi:hypothetical protein
MPSNDHAQSPNASKLVIPDSVKRKAKKCTANFSCLTTGCCGSFQEMCKSEEPISDGAIWITAKPLINCSYYSPFATSHICTCPVRHYLHTWIPAIPPSWRVHQD